MNRTVAIAVMLAFFTAVAVVPALSASAQATSERELQTLVNDTAFQLKLTYRHNATELANHYKGLNDAVAAWNASARGEADDGRLAQWLREAIRSSMPGSAGELPEVPKFDPKPKPATPPAPIRPEELPAPAATRANRVTQTSADTSVDASSPSSGPALNRTPSDAPLDRPEDQAPAEQTLMRPTSGPSMTADEFDLFSGETDTSSNASETQPVVDAATTEESATQESTAEENPTESVEDFWSEHPAGGELPAELSSGDPFLDDPAVAEE